MRYRTLCLLVFIAAAVAARPAQLVVHEWGTITTVHDAKGVPATGLNRIEASDELPDFVHRFEPEATRHDPTRALRKSSLVPGRPDVTMRLETPVIYFHPPAGAAYLDPIDVRVSFRGGVINEFYPDAQASVLVDVERVVDKMDSGIITALGRQRAQQLRGR